MTTKADFTEEEWKLIATAPTTAGMAVALSERGGSFRESFSMAKAYAEARSQHGESQLLDELVGSKPEMDKTRRHSVDEARTAATEALTGALALIEAKGTPEELEDYKKFVRGLAERVAAAHSEHGQEVSPAEAQTLAQIDAALGS